MSFEFRFECAKLLLELDESTDAAMDVLEELLEERDDVADVWHLLAPPTTGAASSTEPGDAGQGGVALPREAARATGAGLGDGEIEMLTEGTGRGSRMASRRTWRS